jgi:hypothetical protein
MGFRLNRTVASPATPTNPATPGTRYHLDPIDACSDSPPAYNLAVDPHTPIPNIANNPYHQNSSSSEDSDAGSNSEDNSQDGPYYQEPKDDMPEMTVNVTSQIKGHENIVSVNAMDAKSIAEMVRAVAKESAGTQMNITINCSTTIIGSRNIVGPDMVEAARHMQQAKATGNFPKRGIPVLGPPQQATVELATPGAMAPVVKTSPNTVAPSNPAKQGASSPARATRTVFQDTATAVTPTLVSSTRNVTFAVATKRLASDAGYEKPVGKRAREE